MMGNITISTSIVLSIEPAPTQVQRIKINGLFGDRDVVVDMSKKCRILIGENGMGKTTIMKIIYHVLKGEFEKLAKFPINGVEISCLEPHRDNEEILEDVSIKIEMDEIKEYDVERMNILSDIEAKSFDKFLYAFYKKEEEDLSRETYEFIIQHEIPSLKMELESIMVNMFHPLHNFIRKFKNIIKVKGLMRRLYYDVIYLPTYRRIESRQPLKDAKIESHSFRRQRHGISLDSNFWNDIIVNHIKEEASDDDGLIKFGMDDVQRIIDKTLESLKISSVKGFSNVSGGMISSLLKDSFISIPHDNNIDENILEIILQRVGDNISEADKLEIKNQVKTGKIYENKQLTYFLNKLIDVYKDQSKVDDALKLFCKSCNEFLFDKNFYYDESHLNLGLYYNSDKRRHNKISLDKLSSGEKQLISIFSYICLKSSNKKSTNKIILLIDEPELSLSIYWQRKFLPTILKAPNCSKIIAVTHSPFIFDNDLMHYASGASEYIFFS